MLSFRRLDVIIADVGATDRPSNVIVGWELVTQHSGLDLVEFYVERSMSPAFNAGEYDVISGAIAGVQYQYTYSYNDITANLMSLWRMYFYRIRAETSEGTAYSEIRHWETNPRPHELAIIERHDFVLRYIQGQPSFAFIERTTDSAFCPCYDKTAGRSRTSNCKLCLNTGRQQPFFDPIPMFIDYNPAEMLVQISSMGEIQTNQKDCWFSAYPLLKPGDLIYSVVPGTLFRTVKISPIQPQGTTIQQVARLEGLKHHEIEYSVLSQRISQETLTTLVQEWERIKEERMF